MADGSAPTTAPRKAVVARFHKLAGGDEPVREWLRKLAGEDRRSIGRDLTKVEFGWPCGPPLCARIRIRLALRPAALRADQRLFRLVRSAFPLDEPDARVFFTVSERNMVLLHGLIKKSQGTPKKDLYLAARRMKEHG